MSLQHHIVTPHYRSATLYGDTHTHTHTHTHLLDHASWLSHYTSLTSLNVSLGFWLKQYWLLWYKRRTDWWVGGLTASYGKKWHQRVESVAAGSCQPLKGRAKCQRCLSAAFYHFIALDWADGGGGVNRMWEGWDVKALEASCYTVVHDSSGCSSDQTIGIFFNEWLPFPSLPLCVPFLCLPYLFCFSSLFFSSHVNELFSKAEERQSPAHLGTLIAFFM